MFQEHSEVHKDNGLRLLSVFYVCAWWKTCYCWNQSKFSQLLLHWY